MVKIGLLVFIAVSAILVTLSKGAQIPSKEGSKVDVISKIEAKEHVIIPENLEINSKEDTKVPENSEIASKENPKISEVSEISSNDPGTILNPAVFAVAKPHPEIFLFGVKPVVAAVEIDAETAEFLKGHPHFFALGSYGEKKYFGQRKYRDYKSAKGACEGANLTLVEINTEGEADFLFPRTPTAFVWTAGETLYNYIWSVSKQPVTLPVNVDPSTILRLQFDSTFSLTSKQLLAKRTTAKAYTLCQKLTSVKEGSKSC